MLQTHHIDAKYCGYRKLSAIYLLLAGTGECALVDTGTPGSFDSIINSIRYLGANPAKLSSIFLTHCHLDHSANVSLLTRRCPNIRVYCSPNCCQRVASPADHCRIMSQVVGSRWESEFQNEVLDVPSKFFVPTHDGMRIPFGSAATIRVLHTPGHCPDHVSFVDESSGTLFAGDALGLRYAVIDSHKSFLSIPVGFNAEDYYPTLKRFAELDVKRAAIAHYAYVENVKDHTAQCKVFLDGLMSIGRAAVSAQDLHDRLEKFYISEFGPRALNLHRVRGNLLANYLGLKEWRKPSKEFAVLGRRK
jgi:glyoxylase-like metal-dependent hydrolase (beta-lactamase superfamily II)